MSASDTPTPRTDAIESRVDYEYDWLLEHSRQLERELAATERENQRLRAIFPKICEAIGNGSFCTGHGNSIEFLEDIPEEVRLSQQATELLAEALKSAMQDLLVLSECADETGYVDGHGFLDMEAIQKAAREALSAWEGRGNDPLQP